MADNVKRSAVPRLPGQVRPAAPPVGRVASGGPAPARAAATKAAKAPAKKAAAAKAAKAPAAKASAAGAPAGRSAAKATPTRPAAAKAPAAAPSAAPAERPAARKAPAAKAAPARRTAPAKAPARRSPGAARGTGQHHGDLRNALLEAALELVAGNGPRGFTVAEAARRAGVSSAAPYKHFVDRDALLAALAVRAYDELGRRLQDAAAEGDAAGRLVAAAQAYVDFAVRERPLFEVAFESGLDKVRHPDVAEASARALAALAPAAEELGGGQDLVLAATALAHGHAVYLLDGSFGPVASALPQVRERVGRAARALLAA